jgi:hypothetical protein
MKIVENLLRAGLLGFVIAISLIVFDISHFLNRSSIFEQIELGMPEEKTTEILYSNEIRCLDAWSAYRCTFDDYWRTYTITIEPVVENHPVVRKTIAYKRHTHSTAYRLLKFLHLIA